MLNNSKFKMFCATELWQRETSLPSIPTFSQSLDKMLGNDGIQLSSITELLGLPGSGKTQLCLQLCASIQVPKVLGGLNAEALYIDTNTNFSIFRFKEILEATLVKCQRLLEVSLNISEQDCLDRLHYVNAFGLDKFCAFMHNLPKFLEDRPNIKLVVIDSIVYPFKEGIEPRQRTGLLFRLTADLQRITNDKQIAVVLTNEMSTRVGLAGGSVVGALGDAWAHRCNHRVLLTRDRGLGRLAQHSALLVKSHTSPSGVAHFQITKDGVRDIG